MCLTDEARRSCVEATDGRRFFSVRLAGAAVDY